MCAKTLIGQSACSQAPCGDQWKRAALAFERAPGKVHGIRRQRSASQGVVELGWDLGNKIIVAHVVPGNLGLLLSRSDPKPVGATTDLNNDPLQLESPRTTLEVSTTPAGHYENDFLNLNSEVAFVDSPSVIPENTVKVLAKRRRYVPAFMSGTGRSPETSLLVSEMLSDQRLQGQKKDMACSSECVLSPPSSDEFVSKRAISILLEHVEGDADLCASS